MFSAITKQSRASLDTIMKTSSYGGLTVSTSPSILHHCSNGRPSFMSPTKCKVAMKWTCIKSEMLRYAGTPTSNLAENQAPGYIHESDVYTTVDSNADVMREDLQSNNSSIPGNNDKARKISGGEGYGAAAPEEQELYENMKGNSKNPGASSKSSNADPTKSKSTDATNRATAHIKPNNS